MENIFNSQKRHIASVPLVLVSKESTIKIGKINDQLNEERCFLTKDPASKSYKLVEKKSNKEEIRFTGTTLADQSSKYLMFRFNQDSGKIEVSPGGDWFSFRKEISYPTMSIEEAEEKMKGKSGLLDYIRNKGVLTKPKKDKKKNSVDISSSGGRVPFGRLNDDDEDMEDEVRQFLTEKVEEQSEEERPEDVDPELKEVDSDIEEAFIKGTKTKEEENKTNNFEEEEFSSDDDALFGDDDEGEEEDDDVDEDQGFSDIDPDEDLTPEQENYIRLDTNKRNPEQIIEKASMNLNQEFIGNKRKPDDGSYNSIRQSDKKQKTSYPLQEVLDNLFAKNKSMTYERIVKELLRSNFSKSEVESHLPSLLSRMCDKYPQGSEFYFFKKSEK